MNDPFVLYKIATINGDAEVAHLLMTSLPKLSRYVKKMDLTWQLKNKMVKKVSEEDKEYYILPNGSIHGEYKEFWPSSKEGRQFYCQTTFKDGIREGKYEKWHSNGLLSYRGFYRDGKKEGKLEEWYSNGQQRLEEFYNDDKLEGKYEEWWVNGQLKQQRFY